MFFTGIVCSDFVIEDAQFMKDAHPEDAHSRQLAKIISKLNAITSILNNALESIMVTILVNIHYILHLFLVSYKCL